MVQAWYQGGASLIDFTDSSNPVEIGFFDRGPISGTSAVLGGFWSNYWYNGETYGSEIARGLDVLGLTPTDQLSANEIAAAREVQVERLNVQHQDMLRWTPSFAVVRSYVDQAVRAGTMHPGRLARTNAGIDAAEQMVAQGKLWQARKRLFDVADGLHWLHHRDLREALHELGREIW
jgi:hypothetical protein